MGYLMLMAMSIFASSEIDPDIPYKRGFSFNELTKLMERSISKRRVIILDCCYSGTASNMNATLSAHITSDPLKGTLSTINQNSGVVTYTPPFLQEMTALHLR